MCTNKQQSGISLIELIMFIVIVSVALAGILLVMNVTEKGSADPLVRKQTLAAAESLLEEIELQHFISSSGVTTCPTGPNPVSLANRTSQDHIVCDYNTFSTTGIYSPNNALVLPNYKANVVITNAALGSIAAGSAVQIDVTVTPPNGMAITATGYRAAY